MLARVAGMLLGQCSAMFPQSVNPSPANFALPRDEIQAYPDRVKAAEVGLTVRDVGLMLESGDLIMMVIELVELVLEKRFNQWQHKFDALMNLFRMFEQCSEGGFTKQA